MQSRAAQQANRWPGLLIALSILASLVTGCATKETVVRDNPERKFGTSETPSASTKDAAMVVPIQITPETVIVDARPSFEYSSAHIPRSISLQWSSFTEPEPTQKGILQGDLFAAARRLARLGIEPKSDVVVVGSGLKGNGEEGRVAWMLSYLGVEKVQFGGIESLKPRMTNVVDDQSQKSAPIWKPAPKEILNVTRAELLFAINKRGVQEPIAFKQGQTPVIYRILDVRSERAYNGREGLGAKKHVPNMDAINIPWRQFFDPQLRVKFEMLDRLMSVGLEPSQRIIVLDEDGVASAAVTMALQGMGFKMAGNYAGGLQDLLSVAPGR